VGFLVGRRVLSASSETHFDAEIYNIGVLKMVQRLGCGSRLLQEFLRRSLAEKVETVWLDVRSSNSNAISFYSRFGFARFAIRSRFYRAPVEDGIVMKLTMNKQNS
ncbi:MAG: GNAT family N-acetyltransferase, partial [Pyrinomonadaceae bacterium]